MPNKLTKIHDKFFKRIFKDIELAKDFFASFLDEKILGLIDLNSIQVCDTTFINEELEESFADVLFSFQLQGEKKEIYISVLLEHKSVVDINTPVQVLYYLAHAYYDQKKNKQPLQFILPLVYYHGEDEWNYSPLPDLFEKFPKYFRKFIPTHETEFVDIFRISDEDLAMLSNWLLSSALLTQKYSRDSKALFEKLNMIFGSINRGRKENLIEAIIVYYMQLIEVKDVNLSEVIQPLPAPIKNIFMSTYEMILEKGIEKGIEQGIEQGIEKGIEQGIEQGLERGIEKKSVILIAKMRRTATMSSEQIAQMVDVDISLVEFIQKKIATGAWTHPENWGENEWSAYFAQKAKKD